MREHFLIVVLGDFRVAIGRREAGRRFGRARFLGALGVARFGPLKSRLIGREKWRGGCAGMINDGMMRAV